MDTPNALPNRLDAEKSPYLLQHRLNPVRWYPWSEEAFALAKKEDKPIFLSVGYSTCYWCHVMERDSFERDDVAAVLNREFISIKVDREERPDVDQIYMDVVVGLNGHGGWPMSVFLTPDGKPFWGGTFFWRPQFLQLLEGISNAWKRERDRVTESADSITAVVSEPHRMASAVPLSFQPLDLAGDIFKKNFDPHFGGFSRAPKFPPSQQLRVLLREYRRLKDTSLLEMVTKTLDGMLRGGLFDQIGGGFARYSTDEKWLVPHFEKMLYDNALLCIALIETFQLTGEERYRTAAKETLAFLMRDMTSAGGGFYSAIDAGEVDKEGEFYCWTKSELERVLDGEEFHLLAGLFDITEGGNFENGEIILAVRESIPLERGAEARYVAIKKKLRDIRAKRKHPHLDDKILASWNGLAIEAFSLAAQVFESDTYLTAATRAAQNLHLHLWKGGRLGHRYRDGDSMDVGLLEDYSYVISGLITLYEAGFAEEWLLWALELQKCQDQLLLDTDDGGYFATAAGDVIARKKEPFDGATPSPQSVTYCNLLRLHGFFPELRLDLQAEALRSSVWGAVIEHPTNFCTLLIGTDFALGPAKEIGIMLPVGHAARENDFVRHVHQTSIGPRVLAVAHTGAESSIPFLAGKVAIDGSATAYVCKQQRCDLPVTSLEDFKRMVPKV